jgi:hypothetical protein
MTTKYQRYLARKREKGEKKETKTRPGTRVPKDLEFGLAIVSPIHECLVPDILSERGLGNLVFSRAMPDGRIAAGMFLLDIFCLGVKNATFAIMEKFHYDQVIRNWSGDEQLKPVTPACFRKLVEGGIAYAADLGFKPHADYAEAGQIFGDVQVTECIGEFAYGHEGKPLYVSGPNETPARAKAIVEQLRRCKGEGNYHFLVGSGDLSDADDLDW